jgi:hypothetical protein
MELGDCMTVVAALVDECFPALARTSRAWARATQLAWPELAVAVSRIRPAGRTMARLGRGDALARLTRMIEPQVLTVDDHHGALELVRRMSTRPLGPRAVESTFYWHRPGVRHRAMAQTAIACRIALYPRQLWFRQRLRLEWSASHPGWRSAHFDAWDVLRLPADSPARWTRCGRTEHGVLAPGGRDLCVDVPTDHPTESPEVEVLCLVTGTDRAFVHDGRILWPRAR